jgi:branched-chain amino acid transport system substrate-binding protein
MPRALGRARSASALLIAAAVLVGCTPTTPMPTPTPSPSQTPTGDGVFRIGTLFPSTGPTTFIAASQLAGVNAAVREINAAGGVGGVPVEVVSRDSGDASTEKAEASFAELVAKGVDVVIGPSSSVLAERLLDEAAQAGVPLISPAATYPQLTTVDTTDSFFRTIPSYAHQGVVLGELLPSKDATKVALVHTSDELATSLLEPLTASLAEHDAELTLALRVRSSSNAKTIADKVKAAEPDAVVLATPNNGDQTKALIGALTAAGYGGAKLWLTSQNLADYSQALPAGLLNGANGILEGVQADAAFTAKLKQEDPGLADPRYGPEAYDATVLAALAAILAGDDGGPAVTAELRAASRGGIKCTSFGECIDVLLTQPDIDYDGITGTVNFDAAGDPETASYGVYAYTAENKYQRAATVTG